MSPQKHLFLRPSGNCGVKLPSTHAPFTTKDFIFPSFKTTHTTLFWFLGDTQGARFYDKHGTTLHLFVILFPVQYMEKRFALETKLFDKNYGVAEPKKKGII